MSETTNPHPIPDGMTGYVVYDGPAGWGLLIEDPTDPASDWIASHTITSDEANTLMGHTSTEVYNTDRFGPNVRRAWKIPARLTYTPVDITDSSVLPENRIELGDRTAWFHLTKGEADYLQRCMAVTDMTAEQAGYEGRDDLVIGGHCWAVTQDAAWTCIAADDRDVLCQILHDGDLENVVVHSDDTGN